MRSILFGILALLALIAVSALSALVLVPANSAGPDLQVILSAAHAQGGGKSQGNVPRVLRAVVVCQVHDRRGGASMINTIQDVQGEIEALWISARSTTQAMPDD